jgi:NADPH:quinone reductase-like Zn-dependent oxidoreductase
MLRAVIGRGRRDPWNACPCLVLTDLVVPIPGPRSVGPPARAGARYSVHLMRDRRGGQVPGGAGARPAVRRRAHGGRRRRHAQAVRELTDGNGAQVVLDFVGEGTVADGVGMLAAGGSYYVVGYGDTLSVPTSRWC